MAYGDNEFKRKGIELEEDTCQMILAKLESAGYIVWAKKSSIDEDHHFKIDYYLNFSETTPFHGMTEVPIDIKVGDTYTVINGMGENTLESSKSEFIIFRIHNNLYWANKTQLKKWIEDHSYMVKESFSGNGSKYIKIKSYPYFNIF